MIAELNEMKERELKGRKPVADWPQHIRMRDWQWNGYRAWEGRDKNDFLLVATPGAGKTRVALWVAHQMLRSGEVTRIVIVCPTEHLRRQWADAAHEVGLSLDPRWLNASGREVAEDYQGIVVTYQQVSFAPDLFDKGCEEPTLAIFDELHHAADNLCWGAALRQAFHRAAERLALSGTPFRNDGDQIPFVRYAEERSQADFTYGYAEALADGVCRPIFFPTINARVRWASIRSKAASQEVPSDPLDESIIDCWLLDDLSREQAAERMRTVLDPNGDWLPSVLKAADERLSDVRGGGHPDAGALVIAIDQAHAKKIAALLRKITGDDAVVAISEDPEASQKIRQFAEGRQRFLVCVRMVSEGVDIPRLRVGVYATNVTSELFLRQAVGRFVRVIPRLGEQSATFFLPAVEPLISYARGIKEERDKQRAAARESAPGAGGGASYQAAGIVVPLSSTPVEHDTIFDGASFSPSEIEYAERLRHDLYLAVEAPLLAQVLRKYAADHGVFVVHRSTTTSEEVIAATPPKPAPTAPHRAPQPPTLGSLWRGMPPVGDGVDELPVYLKKEELRKQLQRAASRLAGLMGVRPWVLHKQWIEVGGMAHEDATEVDLRKKLGYFLKCIAEINRQRQEKNGR